MSGALLLLHQHVFSKLSNWSVRFRKWPAVGAKSVRVTRTAYQKSLEAAEAPECHSNVEEHDSVADDDGDHLSL